LAASSISANSNIYKFDMDLTGSDANLKNIVWQGKLNGDLPTFVKTTDTGFSSGIPGTAYYRLAIATNYYYLYAELVDSGLWADVGDHSQGYDGSVTSKLSDYNNKGTIITIGVDKLKDGTTTASADWCRGTFPARPATDGLTRIYMVDEPILIPLESTNGVSSTGARLVINATKGNKNSATEVYLVTTAGQINDGDITQETIEDPDGINITLKADDKHLYQKMSDNDPNNETGTTVGNFNLASSQIDANSRFTSPGATQTKLFATNPEAVGTYTVGQAQYFYVRNNATAIGSVDIYLGGLIENSGNSHLLRIAVFANGVYQDTLSIDGASTYYGKIIDSAHGSESLDTYSSRAISSSPTVGASAFKIGTLAQQTAMTVALVIWYDGVGLTDTNGAEGTAKFELTIQAKTVEA
jgi:hypothetical protein